MADIKWLGHACFRVRGREAMVLMDPVTRGAGVNITKQKADIVTLSDAAVDRAPLNALDGEYTLVAGPGEYEVQDVFITGIRTNGKKKADGTADTDSKKDFNTVYLLEMEDLVFCHLGRLNGPLSAAQAEAMGNVDVLFVPIGSGLSTAGATEVIGQIEPKIVVPMQYRVADESGLRSLNEFIAALGFSDVPHDDKLTVRKTALPDTMTVAVLDV